MIIAKTIEFFKDLSQYSYDGQYYDLHNNYDCQKISFINGVLLVEFINIVDGALLSLKFTDVKITKALLFNSRNVEGSTTIDNIYRGRMEMDGELIDVSKDGRAYFYLEFYEGQVFEFWAQSVGIE